jgi:hypothetical protein
MLLRKLKPTGRNFGGLTQKFPGMKETELPQNLHLNFQKGEGFYKTGCL